MQNRLNTSQISISNSPLNTINSIRNSLTSRHNNKKLKNLKYPHTPITILPLDKYNDLIQSSMKNYHLTYEDEKKSNLPKANFITYDDQVLIKRMYNFNKSFENKLGYLNEESALKVNVPELNYRNPYNSISILRNNHFIYNEINKDFLLRQKQKFDDSIKIFEGYTMKYKVKMPKIRVAVVQPKFDIEVPVIDMNKENENSKKKKDEKVLPPIPQNEQLRLFSYYKYPNVNFPEGREQFSLSTKGNEIIISGGISSQMKQLYIWSLNVNTLSWKKIKTSNATNCRFGHSGIIYQNKMYLFGGRTKYTNSSLTVGFEIYNFNDNTFSTPQIVKNGVSNRRNHISELLGTQMLIHGGVSEDNEILNDTYILNFNPLKWNVASINYYTPGPKLFGHSSCTVIPNDVVSSHKFSIYKYPDTEALKNLIKDNRVKEKGIYIFGGKNKENGGICNQLWILILGKKPLDWVQPVTGGKPPSPRYFHSMNYYEKGGFIIIHGGRNDEMSDSFALNDTFILDLENFNWMKIELYNNELSNFNVFSRCGHQSVIYSNKLIILGGMNSNNYLGSALLIVNLDFYYNSKMRHQDEMLFDKLDNNDEYSKNKIRDLKNGLRQNHLGIVTDLNLPPIK